MKKQLITMFYTLCCGAATATGVFDVRDATFNQIDAPTKPGIEQIANK